MGQIHKYVVSTVGMCNQHENLYNSTEGNILTAPYIAWKIIDVIYVILDAHSTECPWHAF